MTTPCEQAATIGNINHTLDRMERTQDRLVAALERVADQGARIDNLESDADRNFRDLETLYSRIRDVELVQVSRNKLVEIATSKYIIAGIIAMAIMTLTGTICDLLYHQGTTNAIINVLRGPK